MILLDYTINPPKVTIIENKGGRPKKIEKGKIRPLTNQESEAVLMGLLKGGDVN